MKKTICIILALLLAVSIIGGCGRKAVPPVEPNPTGDASMKIVASAADAEGKIIRHIDENTVEIEMNVEDTLGFIITDVKDQMKDMNHGDMVKFSYEPDELGQLKITKIEKIK